MPGSYQVNDRKRKLSPTPDRRTVGLAQDALVFCCFNQTYKILPDLFDAWMRILAAVPGSILWLLESNPWAIDNLRREAALRGVDSNRLVRAAPLPLAEHLARMGAADLFLDTMPYNAHTTASDALWAGLPVLTCPADTFASRVAGSLLGAVGMPELIAGSLHAYEAMAVRLASNRAELTALRRKLAACRSSAPLFDTPAFARELEAAFRQMWENYVAGRPPRRIELA
jgi:predicted O-linked N-acetylglucosamine transferase (SPINDLY family)